MYAQQNEINVVDDKLYLFPCSKSALCVKTLALIYALFIDSHQPRRMCAAALSPFQRFTAFDVLFLATVSRSGIPSVTFPTAFMGQQVAELQLVTSAILITWANKSALEEMSVNKR